MSTLKSKRKLNLAEAFPEIAAGWHPTKNKELTPEMVPPSSDSKVWWLGKCGHEWQATVNDRKRGRSCPYCSGRRVLFGFNDLATKNPELTKEWHPTKNGNLTPEMVTAGSGKKVWWQCKHNHEWEALIHNRAKGRGCPYCSGHRIWVGFNDLAITHPNIASEWHPNKNGALTPEMVTAGSNKKIWWQCEHGHEWQATVANRTNGRNCPYCSKNGTSIPELTLLYYIRNIRFDAIHRYRDLGFELDIYIPELKIAIEYDGHKYHKNTKKDIIKNRKCLKNDIKLYRIRETGLSELNDSSVDYFYKYGNDISFSEVISNLLSDISETEIKVNVTEDFAKINDFIKHTEIEESLAKHNPELAAEWHPTKNGSLIPEMVTPGSGIQVWWQCKAGHEWKTRIKSRTYLNTGCPYCSGRQPILGKTDLATKYPQLSKEWHPNKNGALTPQDVSKGSKKKVWWQCDSGHEWQSTINNRTKGNGCPYCAGKKALSGFNDFATTHPALAREWHSTKNKKLTPNMVKPCSNRKVWWQCSHCGHEYQRIIANQTKKGHLPRCPHCKTPVTAAKSA